MQTQPETQMTPFSMQVQVSQEALDEVAAKRRASIKDAAKRRYEMALESQCACNPSGLINTLMRWSREIIDAGGDTMSVRNDPAMRLATYQLAFLCGVSDSFDYNGLYAECQAKLKEVSE